MIVFCSNGHCVYIKFNFKFVILELFERKTVYYQEGCVVVLEGFALLSTVCYLIKKFQKTDIYEPIAG